MVNQCCICPEGVLSEHQDSRERPKKRSTKSPSKSSSPYQRRKVADPLTDYLESKKSQGGKDLDVKLEIHRDLMKDNEDERSFRREQLELEKERLRVEEADRNRRYVKEQADSERMFSLLTEVIKNKMN